MNKLYGLMIVVSASLLAIPFIEAGDITWMGDNHIEVIRLVEKAILDTDPDMICMTIDFQGDETLMCSFEVTEDTRELIDNRSCWVKEERQLIFCLKRIPSYLTF